ncbi:MAG: hypothetical protein M4579_000018 [Chaenotheca gracillima]|nr:MAG: hypothetical protein M4579_000018 [Chaenotheca gracillima]
MGQFVGNHAQKVQKRRERRARVLGAQAAVTQTLSMLERAMENVDRIEEQLAHLQRGLLVVRSQCTLLKARSKASKSGSLACLENIRSRRAAKVLA